MRLLLWFLILTAASPLVSARMYQWDDPDTGTPQLSGKPPYWYRSDEQGPRIFVIENGRVVDDTAVKVPDNQRQQLRQEAFLRAEQDQAKFQAKLEQAARLKAERDRNLPEEVVPVEEPPAAEAAVTDAAASAEAEVSAEAEAMRGLVQEWEKFREESAKKIVHE